MNDGEDDAVTDEVARRASRRDLTATLVVIGALLVIAVGRPIARRVATHPSRDACRALVDHKTDLLAQGQLPRRPGEHRQAEPPRATEDDPSVWRCAHELTLAEADCASKAGDEGAFERCLP